MSPIIGFRVVSYTLLFCQTDTQGTSNIHSSPILFVIGITQKRFACCIMLDDRSSLLQYSQHFLSTKIEMRSLQIQQQAKQGRIQYKNYDIKGDY